MTHWGTGGLSGSVRRRTRRRRLVLRVLVPVLHPAEDRWREAGLEGEHCTPIRLTLPGGQP